MKEIKYNDKVYISLGDNKRYNFSDLNETDIDIMLKYELITEKSRKQFSTQFVGEFITPNKNYICFPKNIEHTKENITLVINLLKALKDIKYDKKRLITNKSYNPNKGEIYSDNYYYEQLKETFLDYVTYEFIYPSKRIEGHTFDTDKMDEGDMDIFQTDIQSEIYGGGAYYTSIDKSESKIGNIYYSTLKKLADEYGNNDDIKNINEIYEYITEQGFKVKEDARIFSEVVNNKEIIKDIEDSDVDSKHNHIKQTLLDYYNSEKISEKYDIYAFCARRFEYVWEFLLRKALKNCNYFKKKVKDSLIKQHRINVQTDEVQSEKDLDPDIYSDYNNIRIIGDAKYYDSIDVEFSKELYNYNIALDQKYPIIVFSSSNRTLLSKIYSQGKYKVYIFLVDVFEVMDNVMNKKDDLINKVHKQLKNKNII